MKTPTPICPVCFFEATEYYLDDQDQVIGCNWCVRKKDALDFEMERVTDNTSDTAYEKRHK